MISGVTIRIRGFFVFLISVGTAFFFTVLKVKQDVGGSARERWGGLWGLWVGLGLEPDAEEFGDAPCLGGAAALGVGGVAVEDFGELADAAVFEEVGGGGEEGAGVGFGVGAVGEEEGFGVGGEGPGPGGAVVVGGFALGVFVAGVGALIGVVGVVEELVVVVNGGGGVDGLVGEAADGAGDEEFLGGVEEVGLEGEVVEGVEGDGEELVGAEGVVGGGLCGGGAGGGDEVVGEVALVVVLNGVEGLDGVGDGVGEGFPLGVLGVVVEEVEGGVPEGLDFDGVALAGGAGGVVGVHPGEVGGGEDEGGWGVHVDAVFGAVDVGVGDGDEDVEEGASVAVGLEEVGGCLGLEEVVGGGEEPEGGVGGFAVGVVFAGDHVGEGAVAFEAGEGDEDVLGLLVAAGGDDAA